MKDISFWCVVLAIVIIFVIHYILSSFNIIEGLDDDTLVNDNTDNDEVMVDISVQNFDPVTQPSETQPSETQPSETQPLTTQPITTQALTTQPITTQAPTTQPLTTQPPVTQPSASQSTVTQPLSTQASVTQPLHSPYLEDEIARVKAIQMALVLGAETAREQEKLQFFHDKEMYDLINNTRTTIMCSGDLRTPDCNIQTSRETCNGYTTANAPDGKGYRCIWSDRKNSCEQGDIPGLQNERLCNLETIPGSDSGKTASTTTTTTTTTSSGVSAADSGGGTDSGSGAVAVSGGGTDAGSGAVAGSGGGTVAGSDSGSGAVAGSGGGAVSGGGTDAGSGAVAGSDSGPGAVAGSGGGVVAGSGGGQTDAGSGAVAGSGGGVVAGSGGGQTASTTTTTTTSPGSESNLVQPISQGLYNYYPGIEKYQGAKRSSLGCKGVEGLSGGESLTVDQAKNICNDTEDCGGFFHYNSNGSDRTCFKKDVDLSKKQKTASNSVLRKNPNSGFYAFIGTK